MQLGPGLFRLGQHRRDAPLREQDAGLDFQPGDSLLFGPETRGLPAEVLERFPAERRVRLPMRPGNRSLNLSNAVAVGLFEALRQMDFPEMG